GALFPDGSKFAFLGAEPGHASRLYVQSISGGAAAPISAEGMDTRRICVSPDGRFVAAAGPDHLIHLYPTGGGNLIDLKGTQAEESPGGFTSDGKGLYVSQTGNPCVLDVIDLETGHRQHLRDLGGLDSSGVVGYGPARVTPDGKTIIAGYGRILSTLYKVTDLH